RRVRPTVRLPPVRAARARRYRQVGAPEYRAWTRRGTERAGRNPGDDRCCRSHDGGPRRACTADQGPDARGDSRFANAQARVEADSADRAAAVFRSPGDPARGTVHLRSRISNGSVTATAATDGTY